MTAAVSERAESADDGGPGLLDLFGAIVMFPAVLAHELTHAAVAWPWIQARSVDDVVHRYIPPRLELEYPAGTPVLAVVAANLAPTLLGASFGPLLVPWAVGLPAPIMAYVLGAWMLYTIPSPDDLSALKLLL